MTFILFFVVLAVLILAHELGHFLVAKWGKIRVDEFGLGLPPRIVGIKKGETLYSLNWLPFGGFVKIFGEDLNEEVLAGPDQARSLVAKSKCWQAAVLVAGVSFNLILAWILISVNLGLGLPVATTDLPAGLKIKEHNLFIVEVAPDSPALLAGLQSGDRLLSLTAGERKIENLNISLVQEFIKTQKDKEIIIEYQRPASIIGQIAKPQLTNLRPRLDDQQVGSIGIAMQEVGLTSVAWWQAPVYGLYFTGVLVVDTVVGLKTFFFLLATNGREALQTVAGPVGIYGMVGEASHLGLVYLLNFVALISINLAVLNLLPFPALDGGRLLFVAIEAITRRPIKPKIANALNLLGFALLILLMFVIVASDVSKLL